MVKQRNSHIHLKSCGPFLSQSVVSVLVWFCWCHHGFVEHTHFLSNTHAQTHTHTNTYHSETTKKKRSCRRCPCIRKMQFYFRNAQSLKCMLCRRSLGELRLKKKWCKLYLLHCWERNILNPDSTGTKHKQSIVLEKTVSLWWEDKELCIIKPLSGHWRLKYFFRDIHLYSVLGNI